MKLSNLAADTALNALTSLLNSGVIEIHSGKRPSSANSILSNSVPLAVLMFGVIAFEPAESGKAKAYPITEDTQIAASGIATFARCLKSDGVSAVCDLECGTGGADINFKSVNFIAGARCGISSLTLKLPKSK